MSNQIIPDSRPKSVHYRLYNRYYSNDTAIVEKVASSHWKECARHFKVRPIDKDDFKLAGYGFGSNAYGSLFARLFAWAGNAIHLSYLGLPGLRQDVRMAKRVIQSMGLAFSQDAFRQVCTLNLLVRKMETMQDPHRILIIGDGHGILAALLHSRYPNSRIFLADLGSVLFFQAYHLHKAFPGAPQVLIDEDLDNHDNAVFSLCPADRVDMLPQDELDLAINLASMQEMDPAVTANYFALLRQRKTRLFYCCNRLEKHLEGGEITRFMDYPWSPADKHLVDGPCPWHQWYFGRGASPNVRLCGVPVPMMHRYDGKHWHRLTRLNGESTHD